MIELKLSTVNAAILLATSRYFGELAAAVQSGQCAVFNLPTVNASPLVDVTEFAAEAVSAALPMAPANVDDEDDAPANVLPFAPANVDDEDDEPAAADLPMPPTTGAGTFAAAGIELDSAGFPWDHRIHASTKTKIGNGTWKLKPRTEPALIDQVRAEYKQAAAVPSSMTPPPLPQAAAVEPAPSQPAPLPAAAPAIAPAVVGGEKPTNPGLLFASTLRLYAEVEKAGKVAPGSGEVWAKAAGLPSLASLIARPDLCGQFYDQLAGLMA